MFTLSQFARDLWFVMRIVHRNCNHIVRFWSTFTMVSIDRRKHRQQETILIWQKPDAYKRWLDLEGGYHNICGEALVKQPELRPALAANSSSTPQIPFQPKSLLDKFPRIWSHQQSGKSAWFFSRAFRRETWQASHYLHKDPCRSIWQSHRSKNQKTSKSTMVKIMYIPSNPQYVLGVGKDFGWNGKHGGPQPPIACLKGNIW